MPRPTLPRATGIATVALSTVLAFAGEPSLHAQQRPAAETRSRPVVPRQNAEPEAPVTNEKPPPYEPQVLKLAEIMGSLAFFSELCGPPEGIAQKDVWRQKAQDFVVTDQMPQARRERFAGAYNRGFQSYRVVYRNCTDNARLSVERLMKDGARVTRELASRSGS